MSDTTREQVKGPEIQGGETYQERIDRAEAIAGIERGLASMRRGEGIPAEEALPQLRSQLGVGAPVG